VSGYVKMFSAMLSSSLWDESMPTRIVWVTMLLMADQDGRVEALAAGIAHQARCTREQCDAALLVLSSPDPESKTQDMDGRRIVRVDGGWQVVNYESYRDQRSPDEQREKARLRMQRMRERQAARKVRSVTPGDVTVTPCDAQLRAVRSVTQSSPSDSDSDSVAESPSIHPSIHQRTVPVPVAARPKEMDGMDGMDGWDGGAPHKSPSPEPEPNPLQGLSSDERRLVAALDRAGYADMLGPNLRITRILQLAADGLTADQADRLWAEAKRKGNKPGALFAKWLDSGTWRDVLADLGLAAKERGLRARAPTAHDVGPVFGETKPIGEISLSSILAGPGSTRTVQPAPEPRAREPEPPPPRPAPMEPRVEPILTPGSAWAKRRARQANANGANEVPDAQVRP
jgi:hypothetical protein